MAFSLLSSPAFPGSFVYTDIHPPGWKSSAALCINGHGEAVGYGTTDSGERGFLWSAGSHETILPPGADGARAVWINGRGEIAGTAVTCGVPHAFLHRGGEYVDPTPGWAWSVALFVGEDGSVMGYGEHGGFVSRNGALDSFPAFSAVKGGNSSGLLIGDAGTVPRLYLPGTGYVDLVLPGMSSAAAHGINESGRVAMSSVRSGCERGFVYNGGWFIDMTPAGWSSSRAVAINNRDQVAGYGDSPEGIRGFLRTGGESEVIAVPGRDTTMAVSVNDLGQVAGTASGVDASERAFVASPGQPAEEAEGGWGCAAVPGAGGRTSSPADLVLNLAVLAGPAFVFLRRPDGTRRSLRRR